MEHVFEEFDEFDCTKLGYATDVEGNLEFWNKYVDHSKVMRRDPNGSIILFDKCKFVYGGDTCDRGYGDLQVLQDLIHLKETYPDRVYLIMGNRDINKLRLPVAMHPEVLSLKPDCYWAHSSSNIDSIPEYVVGDPVSKIKWVCCRHRYFTVILLLTHVIVLHRFFSIRWAARTPSSAADSNCRETNCPAAI